MRNAVIWCIAGITAAASLTACGDAARDATDEDSVRSGLCPVVATWSGKTYFGYKLRTRLRRGARLAPDASLPECLEDPSVKATPLMAFRIVGLDPTVALSADGCPDAVFLSIPVADAPTVIRDAIR